MNYDMNNLWDIAVRNSTGMRKLAALVGGGMPANPALPTGPKSAIPALGGLAKAKAAQQQKPQQGTGKPTTTLTIKADGDGVQALKDILSSRAFSSQPGGPSYNAR